MNLRMLLSFLFLAVLALAGCRAAEEAHGPPVIRYGEDVCDRCHMIIGDPRFASAYVTETGESRRFDDIGEMFLASQEEAEAVREAWVHDYHGEQWIVANGATYVHHPEILTPMGWGIASFAARKDAEAYCAGHGCTALTYEEIQADVLAGNLIPAGLANHDHGGHD